MAIEGKSKRTNFDRLEGVAVGMVLELSDGIPKVIFPGNLSEVSVPATTLITIASEDIGKEVALGFENGDPTRPIILGRLISKESSDDDLSIEIDGTNQPLEITGEQEITLRCGKASITLTKAGKIILRGTYISSRSSGMNRIKGGSVQLN